MIYFYKHKSLDEFSQTEINLLGYEGVKKFAEERNLSAEEVFHQIKQLETLIERTKSTPLDLNSPTVGSVLENSINNYVDFFNKNANYNKQAYIIIGNIGSGKSTYANMIEEDTHSIIIDPDRFKSGEMTKNGYFEGLTSFYSPEDREKLQKPCSIAGIKTTEKIAQTGMNVILPLSSQTNEKLEKKISSLIKNNYDIHLIYFDAPYPDLVGRAYTRYLIREYEQKLDPNGNIIHGRFVPLSVILSHGEPCFETFAKAYKHGRYKSYKAYYNDKTTGGKNLEIDIPTMLL